MSVREEIRTAGLAVAGINGARGGDDTTTADLQALERMLKALASARRLQILEWLKDPVANFPTQEHGDPIEHGACNLFIVDKLGVSQPAASRHLKVLVDAGLVIPTRRKGWVYYRRNEETIAALGQALTGI